MTSTVNLSVAERLKALRDRFSLTQGELAKELASDRSYLSQIENGKKDPGPKFLARLEIIEKEGVYRGKGHVRISDGAQAPAKRADIMRDVQLSIPRYIPVMTLAEAGRALVAWDNLPLYFAEKVATDLSDPRALAVKVHGDSMTPHFLEGDRVIVSPSREVENGDIVVARLTNGDTFLKLYHATLDGSSVQLASFNPAYPPVDYRAEEFEVIVPVIQRLQDVRIGQLRRHLG